MFQRALYISFSLLCFICFPPLVQAQNIEQIQHEIISLEQALKSIEARFDLVFSYDSEVIEEVEVEFILTNESIDLILDQLFQQVDLNYTIYDSGYIVLTKKKASERKICLEVFNKEGEGLSFVNIYIPELKVGSSSDESGKIGWNVKATGDELVEISYLGFETFHTKVSNLDNCPRIILKPKKFSFEEVVIEEYVTTGIEQSQSLDHIILRPDKVKMVPGLIDADVMHLVQLLPGINSLDESASGLYVRGGTPDQNLILYDGIPIYNGGHFFGMISGFNPTLIDKVDVYRSGFGAQFGGRASSVIDISSRVAIPERVIFDGGLNFMNGDFSCSIPIVKQKLALTLGARKSYTNFIETPTYRRLSERVFRKGKFDDVMEEESEIIDYGLDFDFSDINAKVVFKPSTNDQISLSYFNIRDNLNFDFTDESDDFISNDRVEQESRGLGLNWVRIWSDKFYNKLTVTGTDLVNEYNFSLLDTGVDSLETEERQFNNIEDKTILLSNNYTATDKLSFDFGIQYANLSVRRSFEEDYDPEDNEVERDYNQILTSFFSIESVLGEKLKSNVGLRWNRAFATNEDFYEPRFSLQFIPNDIFQINLSAGYYRQFMSQVVEFNDLGLNQDFWVLADDNENIPVLLSKNFSLGTIFHPKGFMVEVEGYYRKIDGLTSDLSQFQLDLDSELGDEFEFGSGKTWGLDILVKKQWKNIRSWLSYSYNQTRYSYNLDFDRLEISAPNDLPHSLNFMTQFHHNNLDFAFGWRLASGVVYTQTLGLDAEGEPEPTYDLEDINASRLPISHRMDLSIMYNLFKNRPVKGKIGLSFLNLYNRENIMSREYFSVFIDEDDEFELQERDRSMLRFTPNFVFRVSF